MNENKQKFIGNIIVVSILSLAIIISCFIGVNGLANFKTRTHEIDIKGYTKQQIVSDLIVWSGIFSTQAVNLKDGYNALEADKEKVKNYLMDKGFGEEDIIFSSISISENQETVINEAGNYVNQFVDYKLAQNVTLSSDEIDKVTEISRNATDLLLEGVQFQSYAPEYHFTKLDELKVSMLAEATKDATNRAELIATNAGSKLGELTHAKVSSMKVTPLYYVPNDNYDDYYGYGGYVDNDTVSLDKEITVTVSCSFKIE